MKHFEFAKEMRIEIFIWQLEEGCVERHGQKMGKDRVFSFMKLFLMTNSRGGTTTKHGLNTPFLLCLPQAKIVVSS